MIKKIMLIVLFMSVSFTALPICAVDDKEQQSKKEKKDEWEESVCLALTGVAGAAAILSLATFESAESGGVTAVMGAIMMAASQKVGGGLGLIGSGAGAILAALGGVKYKILEASPVSRY